MPKTLIKPETEDLRGLKKTAAEVGEPQEVVIEEVPQPQKAEEPAAGPDVSLYARLYEECVRRYGEDKCAVVKQMYSDAVVELARRAVEGELRRRGVEYRGRICLEI